MTDWNTFWTALAALTAIASAIGALASGFAVLLVRSEIAKLRKEMADARLADVERLHKIEDRVRALEAGA